MHLGHGNGKRIEQDEVTLHADIYGSGTVTLWSPSMGKPLVKMLSHKGPVTSIAVDRRGYYMATAGMDSKIKIWDIRKYEVVNEYYTPKAATSVSISQRGLLGVGWGNRVTVWKDALSTKAQSPYMQHLQESSPINQIQFVPYEDVLGVGHKKGLTSMVVPGKIRKCPTR